MTGTTDLRATLESLRVVFDGVQYSFASVAPDSQVDSADVLGTFREGGRLSVIASLSYLESRGIAHEGPYACLTVDVHTSLQLVGLTAVMATALTEAGISANVVAAYAHDHVFVPWDRRDEATRILEALKDR